MLRTAMTTPRRLLVVLTILTVLVPSAGPVFARTPSRTRPLPPPAPAKRRAPARIAPAPPPAPQPPGPDGNPLPAPLGVDEGILVDAANGKVLWQLNADQPRPPASLTKILTALVVLQHANMDQTQTVTDAAYNAPGANTYAKPGWTYSVEGMLWALLLVSGNDMAISLAQRVSPDGTVAGFVQLMNQTAAQLGATSTVMVNPHGMDAPGHVSTARDLALLTIVAMKNPTFAQMVGTVQHSIPWDGGEHTHLLVNHNKLLTLYPGTIGVKTGYTNGSGNSLVSEVTRDGHTLLVVVLNAKSPAGYNDSKALYDWGFQNFDALEAKAADVIQPLPPSPVSAAAKKAGAPVAEAAALAPGSHPIRDAIPLDNVLLGVLIASVIGAWVLSHRRGANETYRSGGNRGWRSYS
jgi:D-alanyl-D-alanine carboxypeptidase